MKYKPKKYAAVLAELALKETTSLEEKKFSDNFFRFLEKNRDISKAKEIIDLAESLFFKKTGKKKIVLETARKIDFKKSKLLESFAKNGDIIQEKINEELIAGVKITFNDEKQIDFSLSKKIENIF